MNKLLSKFKALPFSKSIPLAVLGLAFAFFYINQQTLGETAKEPTRPPAISPYEEAVAGVGIVEPVDESIAVAPHFSGQVAAVYVKVGQAVQAGDPLLKLDTETLEAQRQRLGAEVQAARARLAATAARKRRLGLEPRDIELPPLRARVASLTASLRKAEDTLTRLENVADTRAVSEQQVVQQRLTVDELQAQLQEAEANLSRTEAGAWAPELDEAEALIREAAASVESLEAQLAEVKTQIAQATLKAPIAGKVLQVNTRQGETIQLVQMAGGNSEPAIMLGNTSDLQVRVDIDEVLASRVKPGMPATAIVKGDRRLRFPLRFDHIEPFMVPKTSLTGSTAERKDVRVLQVVYRFTPPQAFTVYPGQQVEVYLNTKF